MTALSGSNFSELSPNCSGPVLERKRAHQQYLFTGNSETERPITPSLFISFHIFSAEEPVCRERVIRSLYSIANAAVLFDCSVLSLGIMPRHASNIATAIAAIIIFLALRSIMTFSSIVQREAIKIGKHPAQSSERSPTTLKVAPSMLSQGMPCPCCVCTGLIKNSLRCHIRSDLFFVQRPEFNVVFPLDQFLPSGAMRSHLFHSMRISLQHLIIFTASSGPEGLPHVYFLLPRQYQHLYQQTGDH